MTSSATYEVKPPSAILAEDVICQSFIQSSSTLAYACLLIRRGRHDLAAHVLHSLEAKPASRFKDMVFYLQSQIGIETGDFVEMKRRLASRAHQHPNDMVALSLLEACVFLEWDDWQRRHPAMAVRTMTEERAEVAGPEFPTEPDPPYEVPAHPYQTLSVPTVPSPNAGFPIPTGATPSKAVLSPAHSALGRASGPSPYQTVPAAGPTDFGMFQTLAADPNTHALTLWDATQRKQRATGKKSDLEALVSVMPEMLPSGLTWAVRALEGGEIHKICFSFQAITVTSMHAGSENLGLVTGNMHQSLLTMVRAENIFLKGVQGSGAVSRTVGAGVQ